MSTFTCQVSWPFLTGKSVILYCSWSSEWQSKPDKIPQYSWFISQKQSVRVVPPVLFQNWLPIEIPHGVTAISLTYHPHHAKLQVLTVSPLIILYWRISWNFHSYGKILNEIKQSESWTRSFLKQRLRLPQGNTIQHPTIDAGVV